MGGALFGIVGGGLLLLRALHWTLQSFPNNFSDILKGNFPWQAQCFVMLLTEWRTECKNTMQKSLVSCRGVTLGTKFSARPLVPRPR